MVLLAGCGTDEKADDADASFSADQATIKTNRGDITVTLFADKTPTTVSNFVGLATGEKAWTDPESGDEKTGEPLYDGTIFHRVIPGFMIQGGDPLGTGTGGPGFEFKDEIVDDLTFDRPYLLAMANAGPGTNGSQFFITTVPTPHLDGRHTIFGEVADDASKAVVDEIAAVPTESDLPVEPVVVESVVVAD
ncbi:peptidylprolyl isomerase [Mumia sp. zg.B17]|nr:peptidylprolyl isomerase [Mumia sp. zg.B17]